MSEPAKTLRGTALLSFPGRSLKESLIDEIAAGGFTDVGAGLAVEPVIENHGFSLAQGAELATMCQRRGQGLVAFTGYQSYFPERIALEEPLRLMVTSDGHPY